MSFLLIPALVVDIPEFARFRSFADLESSHIVAAKTESLAEFDMEGRFAAPAFRLQPTRTTRLAIRCRSTGISARSFHCLWCRSSP